MVTIADLIQEATEAKQAVVTTGKPILAASQDRQRETSRRVMERAVARISTGYPPVRALKAMLDHPSIRPVVVNAAKRAGESGLWILI